MKVLRLGFKNLNSLAGVWDIDFTHPDYVSSGIFAITGPTGAGKTTILDAICLALYGQTPRLGRITQSENELMSRQTGECSAEVEFETVKGRFRCHWSQHRSRKQADGQLQQPRHEIAEAVSGTILESKLKAVTGMVEEVTGMDFDRFTRSMLLAQGGFAAFLQARPDERAPILEQITGTGIYSLISIKVHERTTEERRKLDLLRADLNGMLSLSPEEEAGLRDELAGKERETAELAAVAQMSRERIAWGERIEALEAEFAGIEEAWRSFELKKETAVPELEQLARGNRALSLDADYANHDGIRKQQDAEQTERAGACERLPVLQQALKDAAGVLKKTEAALQNSRDEQTREAALIRKTRELDVKLDETHSRIQGLETETEKLKKQGIEYLAAVTQREDLMRETGRALQSVEDFLAVHGADAGLAEALTGIGQQVKALRALGEACSDRLTCLDRQTELCTNAGQAQQQSEAAWQGAVQAAATAGEQLGAVSAAREALLQERTLPSWRVEAEVLVTRQNRLETLHATLVRIEETGRKLEALKLRQQTFEITRQELSGQEETLTGECALRDSLVRQLQEKVVLLNRVRDLEAERSQLLDGAPCPLCGAVEHPYATGNVPCPDEAGRELEMARKAAQEAGERLSGVKAEQVGVRKELEQSEREQNENLQLLSRDEALRGAAVVELELGADAASRSDLLGTELDSCREALAGCRGIILRVEQKEEDERRAKEAYDKARDDAAGQDKARQAAALGYENAVSERRRLERECAALRADLDRTLAEVERAVEPYGCMKISLQNADEVLAELARRRNLHGERLQERELLAKKRADLDSDRQKQQALLAETDRSLAATGELLRDSLARGAELAGSRRDLFGDRNPDSEEKRLADALREAGERRDASWREEHRLQAERAGLEEQIRKLTASIAAREATLAEREPALRHRMTEAGFADEAAFLQARLPQVRFDELSRLAEGLRQEETEIQARRQDRAAVLLMERDKRLSDMPLDRIREENAAVTMQLSELQQTLGALGHKLRQHMELQQRQGEQLQAVEMQKKESARWEQLHALIGSSDGKKFRNFAQGLTFELMVAHANRQLQKMSDRYILVRDDSEPLELNVIDNYQAGEIRSTKNLSGGESFIASLALSLGLSGMASRNVRVDSLFLDEGFGTLDEDALETALETLSGLQQDGKLIGIISHVPALKERIGTRIQVEAGSTGRSSLSGPGCRRVG